MSTDLSPILGDPRSAFTFPWNATYRLACTLFDADAESTKFIELGFELALETDVAVGFHIDDAMFWARRNDLWSDPNNVEALDWDGTPNTGRSLDWQTGPGSKADAAPAIGVVSFGHEMNSIRGKVKCAVLARDDAVIWCVVRRDQPISRSHSL